MIWILEMIVVVVVANYVIRGIDRLLNRKHQQHAVGEVIPSRPRRDQAWTNEQMGRSPFKFPREQSRA